jgi:hypothetical protein
MGSVEVDPVLLEQVLGHIHNWFVRDTIVASRCAITDGALPDSISSKLPDGQWYVIGGSYLNDGLHRNDGTEQLEDEVFSGTIGLLAIPRPLLQLVAEIGEWQESGAGKASEGPYASESFGGYSYTLKSDSGANSGAGGLTGWRLAFRDRLNQFRKMS